MDSVIFDIIWEVLWNGISLHLKIIWGEAPGATRLGRVLGSTPGPPTKVHVTKVFFTQDNGARI
jgi:hypothetical protein